MVQKMDRDLPDFVGREKKGQAALRRLFFRAATRRSEKPERRDFPSGPAKRVRQGSTGVEWFFDFRRLGVARHHFIILCFISNPFLYRILKRVIIILEVLLGDPPPILPKKKATR
tara:strand:+ start:230 stop:574 length:345 start_codon:yes stop_codon:yes gene_type:complete